MAGIHFDITGDNRNFLSALQEAEQGVKRTSAAVEREGGSVEKMFERIRTAASLSLAGFTVAGFARKVAEVRGEFQQLEVAFETMLGSAEQAGKMMDDMTRLAATTPFDLKGVANGAKQLLAYGMEADKVEDTLRRLGDVAAGLGIQIGDLTYLYGTTMAQGRMYTQDLNQFTGRGIPMLRELANQFGVAESEVKGLVEAGKIGFPEVERVIKSLTDAGGQFGGLMEAQSHTITGQISNIEDSLDMMFNEMGKSSEGAINTALEGVSFVVEHWKEVGSAIISVAAAYGTYKAAVVAAMAAQRVQAVWGSVTAFAEQARSVTSAKDAMLLLNIVTKASPWGLVLGAVAGAATAFGLFGSAVGDASEATDAGSESLSRYNAEVADEQRKIDAAFEALRKAKKGTEEYRVAKEGILSQYGQYLSGLGKEVSTLGDVEAAYKAVTAAAQESARARAMQGAMSQANEAWGKSYTPSANKLWKALRYQIGDEAADAEIARLNDEMRRHGEATATTRKRVAAYFKDTAYSSEVYKLLDKMSDASKKFNADVATAEAVLGKKETETVKATSSLSERVKAANTDNERKRLLDEVEKKLGDALDGSAEKKELMGLKATLDAKKKANSGKTDKGARNAADRRQAAEWKLDDAEESAVRERQRMLEDLESRVSEARLAARESGAATLRAQQEQENREELRRVEREKEDAIKAYVDAEEKIWEQREKVKKAKNASYTERQFDRATVDTSGVERQWEEIISLTKEKHEKADMEAERQALNDYLRQYGTYQEQRLAIAEEYGRKIREAEAADTQEAQKRLDIATLRAEQRKAEGEAADRRVLSNVDWVTTFGRLGSSFEEVIEDALGKINAYIATDDFASRPADEKKEVLTARQGLQDYVGNRSTFAGLDRELATLTERVSALREAEASHESAISQVAMAEAALSKTQKKDSVQYAAASARLKNAKEQEATTADAVREAGEAVATQQTAVADTAGDLQKNIDKLSQGLQGLASGSLGQTVDGLKQLMQSVGLSTKAFGKFQKTLEDTLSAVLGDELGGLLANSLDTVQGLLTGELAASIIAAVTGMVDNILKGILSGGFIMKPLEALKDGLGSLADTLTFGGFSALFGAEGNSKRVAEVTERLTKQNERLENSVEKLTAKIDETAGGTAIKSYEEAYAAQQRLTENKRTILDEQQGYHAAHHSNSYYWGLDKDSLRQINALLGTQLRNEWGDFAQLTAEQMDAIRSHLPDIWTEMLEQGKYDKGEWFEGYADQAGKLEELTAKINENLMGVSFSSLRDDFLSTLMDMESGTEEFGDKFNETMQKAVLNAMLGNAMDEKLKSWYDRLAKTMQEAGGVLTNAQITEARGEYDKMVSDMLALRDQASAITGYTGESAYRQEASVGAWQGMSENTAEELNGRFTAVQINTAQTAERMLSAMETMAALTQGQAAANALLSDISYGIGVGNSHLEDMVKYARLTYTQFGQKLDDLNTNIKRL